MKPTDPFARHCAELLSPLGAVQAQRLFGGVGLRVDGLFIALIAFDRLYLKVGEAHRAAFEAAGCQPFAYPTRHGTTVIQGYRSAPDEALESPEAMTPWARRALEAALVAANAAARRPAARRPRKARP